MLDRISQLMGISNKGPEAQKVTPDRYNNGSVQRPMNTTPKSAPRNTATAQGLQQIMGLMNTKPPQPQPIRTGRFAGRGNAVPNLVGKKLTTPSMSPQLRQMTMRNRNAV